MVLPPKHPKMIKPMVVGYHHFRKHPYVSTTFFWTTFRQQLPKTLAVDNPGTWDSGKGRVFSNKRMSAGEGLHGCWKSEKGECTIGKDPVTARLSYTDASQQMGILKIFSCFPFHLIWHLDSHWPRSQWVMVHVSTDGLIL